MIDQKYHKMPDGTIMQNDQMESVNKTQTWQDYLPLITVFSYILGLTFILSFKTNSINDILEIMENFMGVWFIIFSLFKLINLKGFADGYSMYDIVAKRWFSWGYFYPFLELAFGVAYLILKSSLYLNILVLLTTVVSALGVFNNIRNGSKFQCSCLGTVLKIPLTKISLYENLLMAVMALTMIFL